MGRKCVLSTNPAVKSCNESITQRGSVSEIVSERKKGNCWKNDARLLKKCFQNLSWGWDLYSNDTRSKINRMECKSDVKIFYENPRDTQPKSEPSLWPILA